MEEMNSRNEPILERYKFGESTDYDNFSDVEGTGGDIKVEFRFRTGKKPIWFFTLGTFIVFVTFVIITGISCSAEKKCQSGQIPTLSYILENTTTTSDFAILSVGSLVLLHFTEVYSLKQLLFVSSNRLGSSQLWIAITLYTSVFTNIIFKEWYIMTITAIILMLWMITVTVALYRFHSHSKTKKLLISTVILCFCFLVVTTIYIIFNAMSETDFPSKNLGILMSEIMILIIMSLFTLILIFHTKWVLIETVVKN